MIIQKTPNQLNSFIFSVLFMLIAGLFSGCAKKKFTQEHPLQYTQNVVQKLETDVHFSSKKSMVLSVSQAQALKNQVAVTDEDILTGLKERWGDISANEFDDSFFIEGLLKVAALHFDNSLNGYWPEYNSLLTVLRNANPALEAVTGKFLKANPLEAYALTEQNETLLTVEQSQNVSENAVYLVKREELINLVKKNKAVAALARQEKAVSDILKTSDPKKSNLNQFEKLVEGKVKIPPNPYAMILMLHGYASGLDPHSYLLSVASADKMTASKTSRVGIGVSIQKTKKNIVLVAGVFKGTPAEEAGVKTGDQLQAINGKDIKDFEDVKAIAGAVRGEEGTEVVLRVFRGNQTQEIKVTRRKYEISTVNSVEDVKINDVSVFKLDEFSDDMTEMLKESVKKTEAQNKKFWILDLRNNPGGLVSEAIALTQYLSSGFKNILDNPVFYVSDGKDFSKIRTISKSDSKIAPNVILLTNEQSASASEITSGNLKALGNTFILGSRTYGKGSLQRIFDLNGKLAMGVTQGIYFNGDHRTPQFAGVEPHFNTSDVRKALTDVATEDFNLESDSPGAITPLKGKEEAAPLPEVYPKTLQCLKDLSSTNKLVTEADLESLNGLQLGVEGMAAAKAIECMTLTGEAK